MSSPTAKPTTRRRETALRVGMMALAAGVTGWGLAQLDLRWVSLGLAGMAASMSLAVARQRDLVVLSGLVLSLVLLFHKSFGPIALIAQGPPSIYVTTFDAVLALLFLIWAWEGEMWHDIKSALTRPVYYLPLVSIFLIILSALDTRNLVLVLAELFRMLWMYLVYLYLGLRIRDRAQVLVLLGSLAGFAVIEAAIVVLQWKTGGVFGLGFLDIPTELTERVLDVGQIARPPGTLIHPLFMGATMGSLAVLFFSLSFHLSNRRWKLIALALTVLSVIPIILAHTRAAALGVGIAGLGLVFYGLTRRLITGRQLGSAAGFLALILVVAWPTVRDEVIDNFTGRQFRFELEARLELNSVALEMFLDEPLLGTGSNNYTEYLDDFNRYGLTFDSPGRNPVHNLFLLQLAETGLVGLTGMVLFAFVLVTTAWRLAGASDRLLAGLGAGALGVYVFYAVEEMLTFSLHHDVPRATFFVIAGLVLGCHNLAAETRTNPPRRNARETPAVGLG